MKQRAIEFGVRAFCWATGIVLVAGITGILGFLVIHGWEALSLELIFGDTRPIDALLLRAPVFDGLFPAIAGTFCLVLCSVSLALPLGLASGIYLAEYASPRSKGLLSTFLDVMAGIQSILIGIFGMSVAILLHKYVSSGIRPCLLISAISLALLVLPYIVRSTQVSLEELPAQLRLTAPALGASKLQNILHVLLPRSTSGILSGVILAIGRCAEDTAVILLTGVVAMAGAPRSLLGAYEALPFYIYYVAGNYSDQTELSRAYGAALILVAVCATLFLFSSFLKRQLNYRAMFRA